MLVRKLQMEKKTARVQAGSLFVATSAVDLWPRPDTHLLKKINNTSA